MKGLWHVLLGGTTRILVSAIIIAVPISAIIAEPVPIVRLHPSHYITRPPPLMYGYVWLSGQVENWKIIKLENWKSRKL